MKRPTFVQRLLPAEKRGFYREYTVKTPGLRHRGARRIVCGGWQPTTPKFDKDMREQLLDCFRDAADFWAERGVDFRCFYSFVN